MKKTLVAMGILIALAVSAQTVFAACNCPHGAHMKKVHCAIHDKIVSLHKSCPLCKRHAQIDPVAEPSQNQNAISSPNKTN